VLAAPAGLSGAENEGLDAAMGVAEPVVPADESVSLRGVVFSRPRLTISVMRSK
jgi:hypothetical protein